MLFAHYDPLSVVDPYVVHYLREIKALGSEIIFVSGAADLSQDSAKTLDPFCAAIYSQRTLAMDFGSWNLAWQHLQRAGWCLEDFEQLILANDSVYGPLFPLTEMFDSFQGADLYGVTESLEIDQHLQSYFLVFDLNVRTVNFFKRFWKDFRYEVAKQNLIESYEIGLSRRAEAEGLTTVAYIPNSDAQNILSQETEHQFREQVLGREVNNTLYLWDVLISRLRCPFLKTDVAKTNSYGSVQVEKLDKFLNRYTKYPPGLIKDHLARLRKPPSRPS